MAAGRYFARLAFNLDDLQRRARFFAEDKRTSDLREILPDLEAASDAYAIGATSAALRIINRLPLSQEQFEKFGRFSKIWGSAVRVMVRLREVVYVELFLHNRVVAANFQAKANERANDYALVKELPVYLQTRDGRNLIPYSMEHRTETVYPGGLGSMEVPRDLYVYWFEDLNSDVSREANDDFTLGFFMEIIEKAGDTNLRIGRKENRDLTENPAWATKVVAHTYGEIEQKVDPTWLPKLDGMGARGNQLLGKLKELGCGAYGCVYPTGDDGIVLKITTDDTEAEFARELAADLVTPVTVHYHMVIDADAAYRNRPVFFLWREEAKKVGKIVKEPKYGRRARQLIHAQHLAAQVAYELMGHRMKAYKSIAEALAVWRTAAENMGEIEELRFLARGMIDVLDQNKVFFGDVHEGNLGIVTRNGREVWAITDPGHVFVVNW